VEWFLVTLKTYQQVFARAGRLAAKNWRVLGSVFAYAAIMSVTAWLSELLPLVGGFVLSLVRAACFASFLYLVEMIVRTSKVTLDDFRRSFGAYLWDVVGITFVLWIFFWFATPMLLQLPQGEIIFLCVKIAVFVLLNAVPELIYLGHCSALALLHESYEFIAANWIEWFPANLAAAGILYMVASLPAYGIAGYLLEMAVLSLLVYFVMVMRGLLFIELHATTHRGRAFKYRMQG